MVQVKLTYAEKNANKKNKWDKLDNEMCLSQVKIVSQTDTVMSCTESQDSYPLQIWCTLCTFGSQKMCGQAARTSVC